ncbi:DUF4235 domain-containing protein [Fulvivirga sp. M361]|uniref:DUF4235 domain-containing protein n=1 Tax=Fulvivirga sp. M361 TaxID=2594266 RepID=UPI001179D156|nr:DUF4235 domain-containing protein [Fulvivirga sp. M361]TRX60501.1 DUF4235 domain-containing protein [Fulvivirga sp. M361]
MDTSDKKLLLYGIGSILVGTVIRAAARQLWQSTKGTPPPEDPGDPEVDTTQAMAWTVGLAVVSGVAKLLYRSAFSDQLSDLKEQSPLNDEENV